MSNNPLLSKVKLPGRVFQLPSKGLFYEQGVLSETVKNGEIHVRPMSALAELKIRSADLLFSGKIIREVCEECVPEILKPESLVSRDVDGLFIFLVASTYGNQKTIRSIHTCNGADWHDYTIDLDKIMSDPRNTSLDKRELLYQTSLDSGERVILKPVTFADSIELMATRQRMDRLLISGEAIPADQTVEMIVEDILSVIKAVEIGEGESKVVVTNRKHINEWLRTISKSSMDRITSASAKSAEWGFNFQSEIKCKDCGEKYEYDLELNPVSFFSG